jgi:hypothetical protein
MLEKESMDERLHSNCTLMHIPVIDQNNLHPTTEKVLHWCYIVPMVENSTRESDRIRVQNYRVSD